MIQGERRTTDVDREDILNRLSEMQIYRHYLGDFALGEAFCNPLRGEKNPSMVVSQGTKKMRHFDYGDDFYQGDCFDLVQQKYRCDLSNAVQWILKDFGITDIGGQEGVRLVEGDEFEMTTRHPPHIHVVTRNYTTEEYRWWAQFLQGAEDLKRENIHVPRTIYRNYKKLPLKATDLVFCYYYPKLDKWKIYRPLKPKRTKETPAWDWKWDTNLPFDFMEGFNLIAPGIPRLLTGKKKDRLYLSKVLQTDAIYNCQAESPTSVGSIIWPILTDGPCWINGDNDKKGHAFTEWGKETHGMVPILGDMPDMGLEQGHDAVLQHFKSHGWT